MMTMSERQRPDDEPPDDAAPIDDPPTHANYDDIPADHPRLVMLRDAVASGLARIATLEAQAAARDVVDAPEWVSMQVAEFRSWVPYSTIQKWAVKRNWIEWRRCPNSKLVEINLTSLRAFLKRRGQFREFRA
jgi:hypothetical protein